MNIGDKVRIINAGEAFSHYSQWAERHGLVNWHPGLTPVTGWKGTIVAKAPHGLPLGYGTIYAVDVPGAGVFIMHANGIKEVK